MSAGTEGGRKPTDVEREMREWDDVVFINGEARGKLLSETLLARHDDELDEPYEGAGFCTCDTCQMWIPMAEKLEALVRRLAPQEATHA